MSIFLEKIKTLKLVKIDHSKPSTDPMNAPFLPSSPETLVAIEEAEKELRHQLPGSYKKFLIEVNGGIPSEPIYFEFRNVITGKDESTDVFYFYSVFSEFDKSKPSPFYDESDDLVFLNLEYDLVKPPKNLLAIAEDSGGNRIVMDKVTSAVYFWDHDYAEDPGDEATMDNCSLVADSFESFIMGIKFMEESELQALLDEQ